MNWPFPRQHRIELALTVERIELVAAADMGVADENLRKGRAGAGAIPHLLAQRRSFATSNSVNAAFLRISSDFAALQ